MCYNYSMARLPASHGKTLPIQNADGTFSLTCSKCGNPVQAWGPKGGEMVWRHTVPLGSPSSGISKWLIQSGEGYILSRLSKSLMAEGTLETATG